MNKIKLGIGAFLAVLLLLAIFWLKKTIKDNSLDFGTDTEIDPTPTQIVSIKAIGEWEFLAISAEELVDTVRKGLLTNDELARIYFGTLRLGAFIASDHINRFLVDVGSGSSVQILTLAEHLNHLRIL